MGPPGQPIGHLGAPLRCGAPTAQDTSSPVTAATALRGPSPLATAAFGSVAKPWPRRASRRPTPGSRACARHSACRRVSAPTTACRAPPTPWAGSHRSPPGGYAWASCRRAAHLAHRHSTRPARRQRTRNADTTRPPGATRRAPPRQCTHGREAFTRSGRPRRSTGVHPAAGLNPPPGRCRIHFHRLRTLTASRCATSAPLGAAVGTIKGAMSHTSASEPMSALRTLTMGSGIWTSTLPRGRRSHGIGASKRLLGDANNAGDGDPCSDCFVTYLSGRSPDAEQVRVEHTPGQCISQILVAM